LFCHVFVFIGFKILHDSLNHGC
jgi:hypothetical protein